MKEVESFEMAPHVTEEVEAEADSFEMTRLVVPKRDQEEEGKGGRIGPDQKALLPRPQEGPAAGPAAGPAPPSSTDWYGLLGKAVFLATGVYWGVSMQLMVYSGAARHPLALLPNLTWYLSMVGALLPGRIVACRCADGALTVRLGRRPPPPRRRGGPVAPHGSPRRVRARRVPRLLPRWDPLWRNGPLVVASVCDWLGTVGTTIGLTLSGSAIFGIVFSSVSIWAALFARALLGRVLSGTQMAGIAIVTAGLVVSGWGENAETEEGQRVVLGIWLSVAGTICLGLEYVLIEMAMETARAEAAIRRALREGNDRGGDKEDGDEWEDEDEDEDDEFLVMDYMVYMGVIGLALSLLYHAVYTAPRWQELVAGPVAEEGSTPGYLAVLFITQAFSNFAHNLSWFVVVEREGSVATGLLQGGKAVALLLGSAAAFCHRQQSQCLTPTKIAATVIVVGGTLLFYWRPPKVAAPSDRIPGPDPDEVIDRLNFDPGELPNFA